MTDADRHIFDLANPASFRHWVAEQVRFCDTDMAGHVNNVSIAAYVESGRLAHCYGLVLPDRAPGEGFAGQPGEAHGLDEIRIDAMRRGRLDDDPWQAPGQLPHQQRVVHATAADQQALDPDLRA